MDAEQRGRLRARPSPDVALDLPLGTTPLGLADRRDGLLHVPPAARDRPCPLVVLLHGAGSTGAAALPLLAPLADEHGLVLVAPDARSRTWDVIVDEIGPDVTFLDRALERVFARCPIDAEHVAIGGFSDGASYALTLGVANGDLFPHLIAFSPGFAAPPDRVGEPRMFVTHGTDDRVLPIDRCSRRLVALFRAGGYAVSYVEFDGGHVVPADLARRAVAWLLGDGHPPSTAT